MRWFVEISSLGKHAPASTTVCVEAPQWQPALQMARALRGDEGALSNFSIELLDDGYRAIDPTARVKYVVRKAPDDAVLTNGNVAARTISEPPPKPVAKPADGRKSGAPPASDARGPTPADALPVKPARAPAQTRTFASSGAAAIAEPAPAERHAESVSRRPAAGTVNYKSPGAAAVRAVETRLPAFTVVVSRQEQPSARSPLTYREQAYAVAENTPEEAARALVLDQLRQLVRELESAPAGKLVNLAVFDHTFRGRPQRPPLVTLTWKDWKGTDPEVRFPLREGPGNTPTPLAANAATSAPPPAPPPPPTPPTSMQRPAVEAPAEIPSPVSAPMSAPFKAVAEISSTRTRPSPEPEAEPVPLVRDEPVPLVQPEPVPLVRRSDAPPKAEPVPLVTARGRSDPPAAEATPAPSAAGAARGRADAWRNTPRPASTARLAGDELLAELFEAFGDLHFIGDTLAGAEFVLALTLEKLPSEVGILSLFDINRREFVVVRQMGAQQSAVLSRLSERAPIVAAAMRTRRAVVIPNAKEDAHARDERWKAIAIEVKSLVCAPVELGGRYLGLLELANPLDGGEFTDGDGHALTYIGQQFAEFVATHGVVTEAEHVGTRGHIHGA